MSAARCPNLATIRLKVLRPTLATYGGNLFKTMGDGALIEFPSVEDGVRLGASSSRRRCASATPSARQPVNVRCGVALADVFVQGEDRFGAAVGFVVRLQEAAPPGGIAITHSVRWQLAKDLAAMFARTEWVDLKGNRRADRDLDLDRRPSATVAMAAARRRSNATCAKIQAAPAHCGADLRRPRSPFSPSTTCRAIRAPNSIADGIVEEITATPVAHPRLHRHRAELGLCLQGPRGRRARRSSRELGVRYVLEGSLRKAGDRVRITAQLIDAATGAHLWADRYDGVVDNLFDFEDEIAERVAGALRPSIRDGRDRARQAASGRKTSPPTTWS